MTDRHTVDSITSDALDQLYEQLDAAERERAGAAQLSHRYRNDAERAEAAIVRMRKLVADDPSGIFSDDEILAALREQPASEPCNGRPCTGTGCSHEQAAAALATHDQNAGLYTAPAPAPAATQATEPREHCGHLMPAWVADPRSECTLRPGHQGSHADDRGARWWYDPTGNSSGPCTCGGRFPLQHLHADQHQPKEQSMPTDQPTCTASIEGPHIPDTGPVHCTLPAGHPSNHTGPDPEYGNLLWNDHHAGATPHQASSKVM